MNCSTLGHDGCCFCYPPVNLVSIDSLLLMMEPRCPVVDAD